MKLSLWIAFRTLFSRRSQSGYSAIGWIAVIGLMLGVAAQGVALSILGGFEKAFTQSILGFNAHLVLMREGEIQDSEMVIRRLQPYQKEGELTALTPFLYREGLMAHHGKVKGVVLKGIDPLTFGSVYDVKLRNFSPSSQGLSWEHVLKSEGRIPQIILGSDLAESLGVTPEDRIISILSPQGDLKKITDVNNFKKFEVAGVFSSGLYEYDSQFALFDLKTARDFFQAPQRVTGFEMRVGDLKKASKIAQKIEEEFGLPFQAVAWNELNAEIFQALKLEKKLFFLIMGLIVAVAAANLIGLIVVLVADQSKEVSILRAMGIRSKNLIRIFWIQGMLLAVMGVLFGSALGWMTAHYLETHPLALMAKEVYLVSTLPVSISFKNFLGVFFFALFVSFAATQLAARRVVKMDLDLS